MEGRRFGQQTVVAKVGPAEPHVGVLWLVRCDCGVERTKRTRNLTRSKSCGCQKNAGKHGAAHRGKVDPLYAVWRGMRQRCEDPRQTAYKNYGARGIQVCEEWRDFARFRADMGPGYTEGMTIERTDNSCGYSKANCVWATRAAQNLNRRTNVYVVYRGERMLLCEAIRAAGIRRQTYYERKRRGWPTERLFDRPR